MDRETYLRLIVGKKLTLEYDDFKKNLVSIIEKKLKENETIRVFDSYSINQKAEVISLTVNNIDSPYGMNLKVVYHQIYLHGENNLDHFAEDALEMLRSDYFNADDLGSKYTFDVKNIYMKLINTKANEQYLETLPHREFLDLSLIYYLKEKESDEDIHIVITNSMAEEQGYTEECLYQYAMANSEANKAFSPTLDNFDGIPLVTNADRKWGAHVVFTSDILSTFKNSRYGKLYSRDLFLIPSSVHEWTILPFDEDNRAAEKLLEMVSDVNRCQVYPRERLSNNVYRYNSRTGKIEIAIKSDKPLVTEEELYVR